MADKKQKGGNTTKPATPYNSSCNASANISDISLLYNHSILWAEVITRIRSKRAQKRIIMTLQAYGYIDTVLAGRLIAHYKLCGV